MPDVVVAIPCFNEAQRFRSDGFRALLEPDGAHLLFVDDGSSDSTLASIEDLRRRHPSRVDVLRMPINVGKGEAVRQGVLWGLAAGAQIVGYLDADLSTPAEEAARLIDVMRTHPARPSVLIGSRVKLLGGNVRRSPGRHLFGRVFATGASLVLGLPVYDTQCGMKLFRRSPTLQAAVSERFASRWIFDVELIGRLHRGTTTAPALPEAAFVEEVLREWGDPGGSTFSVPARIRAIVELGIVQRRLRRWG